MLRPPNGGGDDRAITAPRRTSMSTSSRLRLISALAIHCAARRPDPSAWVLRMREVGSDVRLDAATAPSTVIRRYRAWSVMMLTTPSPAAQARMFSCGSIGTTVWFATWRAASNQRTVAYRERSQEQTVAQRSFVARWIRAE